MIKRIYEDVSVCNISVDELDDYRPDSDFTLVHVQYDDIESIKKAKDKGFEFLNRTITASISLQSIKDDLGDNIRANIVCDKDITHDMYEIAYLAFPTDRRFHLGEAFDNTLAKKLIKAYIDDANEKNILVFKCYHKERLVGFTIVEINDEITCETILGAVLPEYHKRGVAINLYAYMRNVLAEKGYKEVFGRIASTNVSSINLHVSLGARFADTEDVYCLQGTR